MQSKATTCFVATDIRNVDMRVSLDCLYKGEGTYLKQCCLGRVGDEQVKQ